MSKLRAILRRRWPLLVATAVLGVVAGAGSALMVTSSASKEQVYTASQTIVTNQNSGANPQISQDDLKVTRGAVPVKAAELLGEPGQGPALAAKMATAVDTTSGSITISSNDADPKVAAKRVDAFVQAFLDVINSQLQSGNRSTVDQKQSDLDNAKQQLVQFDADHPELTRPGASVPNDAATQQLVQERSTLQNSIPDLTQQLRDAKDQLSKTVPYSTLGPEPPRPASSGLVSVPTSVPVRAAMLGLLGLLLGGLVAMVIERVNRRIDTREELVEALDLPILAEIGFLREGKRTHDSDGTLKLEGVWAEPYRRVRSAIQFVQATQVEPSSPVATIPTGSAGQSNGNGSGVSPTTKRPQVFLITSTSPGEGKSTTAALTGEALAEVGEPTVVIGGDFRRPSIDKLMGVPRSPSLHDMAQMTLDRPTVDDVVHQSRFPSLYVAPAGKGTREVAGSIEAAKEVATVAVERGATVVFDSSPLQAANDTIDLLPVVDYVIVVVRAGRSTEASLREVVDMLQRMNAAILGLVLIGTPAAGRQQTYYYDYYSPTPEPLADEGARQATGFSTMVNGSAPRSTGVPGRDSTTGAQLAPEPADVRETAPTGREDAPSAPPPWSP